MESNSRETANHLELLLLWCETNNAGIKLRRHINNRWHIVVSTYPRALREMIIFEQYSVSLDTLFENAVEATRRQDEARSKPGALGEGDRPRKAWDRDMRRGWT
jgi:hypothetical protein